MDKSTSELNKALGRKMRLKQLMDENIDIDANITENSTANTLHSINNIIKAADEIINQGTVQERATHTTEVVMDVQVLRMNSELVSKVLQNNTAYSDHLYSNAIFNLITNHGDEDWNILAKVACSISRSALAQPTMLGAIDVQPTIKARKDRVKRSKPEKHEEKRPHKVTQLNRPDKGAEKINMIHDQLANIFKANNQQPVPFYKLIIDPRSFSNSIQNAFQLSFLARDSSICIETGNDGYPQVRLPTKDELKEKREASQSICSLSTDFCAKMIERYEISEPMLTVVHEAEDADVSQETESD